MRSVDLGSWTDLITSTMPDAALLAHVVLQPCRGRLMDEQVGISDIIQLLKLCLAMRLGNSLQRLW